MKYYIYISDSKVDMLLPQIPHETKRKIATEFKIDLKLLSISRKAELDTPEDRIMRLEAVCSFINEYGNVGSVINPDAYIFDSMPLKMLRPLHSVYFTGIREKTMVALGGSLKHLLGTIATSNYPYGSYLSMMVQLMEQEMDKMSNLDKYEIKQPPKDILGIALSVYNNLHEPEQRFEFLAKRLLYEPSREDDTFNLVLATPLYVAIDD